MILVDTDVILDVALDRSPWSEASAALLARLQRGPFAGFVAWHSLANLYYLVRPVRGGADSRAFLSELATILRVAPVDGEAFRFAITLPMADLEDAMQVAAARSCGARWIATRNLQDYERSPVPAREPADLMTEL